MSFSIGDIGFFMIILVFGLYNTKQYYKSKHKKYLVFLIFCIYGLFNRNNMISINGIEINHTIYIEMFRCVLWIPITILGYKLFKKKELF